jgi:hypothetical protein
MQPLRAVFRDGTFRSSPGTLKREGIFKAIALNANLRVILGGRSITSYHSRSKGYKTERPASGGDSVKPYGYEAEQ